MLAHADSLQAVHLGMVEIARSIRTGGFYIGLGEWLKFDLPARMVASRSLRALLPIPSWMAMLACTCART